MTRNQGIPVLQGGEDVNDDTLSVYAACPGSIDEIAELTGLPQDHVAAHLNELESRALVASHVVGTASRRSMVVGSALAVLGIWSMTAPTPAAASSTTGGGGGGGGGTPAPNMYYFTSNGSLYHFGLDQGIIVKTLRSGWAEGDPLEPGQFEYYGSYTVAISSYWDATIDAFPRTIFQDPEDQAWVDYYRTNNLRLPQITRTNYPSAP